MILDKIDVGAEVYNPCVTTPVTDCTWLVRQELVKFQNRLGSVYNGIFKTKLLLRTLLCVFGHRNLNSKQKYPIPVFYKPLLSRSSQLSNILGCYLIIEINFSKNNDVNMFFDVNVCCHQFL